MKEGEIIMRYILDNRNWRAVIETLLGTHGIDYELEVTDDRIILKTNEKDSRTIQRLLQDTLRTPQTFFQKLPYTITGMSATTLVEDHTGISEALVSPPLLGDTVEQGIGVFRKLFGEETFREIALNLDALFDSHAGAYSKEQVLYSKAAKGKQTAKLWHSILEALIARFNDVDILTLRKIWLGENAPLSKDVEDLDSNERMTFRGLVQQCFGVIEQSNHKQVMLYFNYGLLHRFIFPPQIEVQAIQGTLQHTVDIDKKHLLNYVQQLTQGGTLLKVYKESEKTNELVARPLFFSDKKIIKMPHRYTVIIDASGSMDGHLQNLGDHVIQFIEKLRTFDDKAKIRIVFFSDKVERAQTFTISESWAIRPFIKDTRALGGTRLFGTVEDELDLLLQEKTPQNFITPVVLFTDGNDNGSGERSVALARVSKKLQEFKNMGLKVPQLFTMGFGSYDYEALSLLAVQAGTPFTHLQSPKDFDQIYHYLDSIQYEQQVLDFLVRVGDTTHFSIPLTLNGNAQAPGILIPFQENDEFEIEMQGKQLVVSVNDGSRVPLASINDQLDAMLIKAHSIVANDKIDPSEKQRSLEHIRAMAVGFDQQHVLTIAEKDFLTTIRETINYYVTELTKVITNRDVALHQSLQSRARYDLGYTAQQRYYEVTFDALGAE